jgi:hypothetical protein
MELTEIEKTEIEKLVVELGGPISTIQHLLKNLKIDDKEVVLTKIYFITDIRFVSKHTYMGNKKIDEYIRGFGLDFEWEKVKNPINKELDDF